MPGLGFLFKKRFHPSRLDNQKRIFVAEKKVSDKNEREADSAKEVVKEKEMQYYESMGKMEFRDPRTSALKFMYATPQNKEEESGKTKPKQMATVKDYESKIDARTGDDEMVRAFREKIAQSKQMSLGSASSSHEYRVDPPDDKDIIDEKQSRTKGNTNAIEYMTKLEKEVGGKLRTEATQEEMQERFAVLKNAPVEGGYVKGMVMKHKPFNELLRNVHCIRCGAWGHMSGERECPLKDYNPNDYARQQREDPMARMMPICQPTATTSSTSGVTRAVSGAGSGYGRVDRRTSSKYVDEAGDSDPEAEFLASLTRREKKLLLIKLQMIENGESGRVTNSSDNSSSGGNSSDSSSDSSSSSDNNSSDSDSSAGDSSVNRQKRRKHHKSSGKSHKKRKTDKREKEKGRKGSDKKISHK